MTYLQQQILIPASNREELQFLGGIVQAVASGDTQRAMNAIMQRIANIEQFSGEKLTDYNPQMEARTQ